MHKFQQHFKELARNRAITIEHMIILIAVRYYLAKEKSPELLKSLINKHFTPLTNKAKIENGRRPFDSVYHSTTNRLQYHVRVTIDNMSKWETHPHKLLEMSFSKEHAMNITNVLWEIHNAAYEISKV